MGVTREEVIEILEEVSMLDDSMYAYSQAYNDALDMAIEALKAQEPRLLEINELTSWDGIMYIECKGIYPIAAELDSYRSMYSFSVLRYDEPWEQLSSQYGKTWRCWTSRPDEKRRAETPWD